MKRTKENWKESQPENRNGISGLEISKKSKKNESKNKKSKKS